MKKLLLAGSLFVMTGLAVTTVFVDGTNSNNNSTIIEQTENNDQSDNVRENGYRNRRMMNRFNGGSCCSNYYGNQ